MARVHAKEDRTNDQAPPVSILTLHPVCKACKQMTKTKTAQNKELVAQGVSNTAVAFIGGTLPPIRLVFLAKAVK